MRKVGSGRVKYLENSSAKGAGWQPTDHLSAVESASMLRDQGRDCSLYGNWALRFGTVVAVGPFKTKSTQAA